MKYITINSSDRVAASSVSNAEYQLHRPIENAKKIKLLHFSLPNTIYNITSSNNQLTFDDGNVQTLTIPPGAYNITELLNEIQTGLNGLSTITFTATFINNMEGNNYRRFEFFFEFWKWS